MEEHDGAKPRHFIQEIIDADIAEGRGAGRVLTRFPPEPNGYLHIGHAMSIFLNYGLSVEYGGAFNLRFDDTNPIKEDDEFVRGIVRDIHWLGARWPGASRDDPMAGVLFASGYFQQLYEWAIELIKKGRAYVDDLSNEQVRELRGTLTRPGTNSPHRDRSVEENLDLFERMRRGEFPDGSRVLRAKIDMAHPNVNMRDPVMYRILHAKHHRTGDTWCIYPMYDWAHGQSDSIEGITHSICTLEFENHRPLYNWFIDTINDGRTDDGSGPWGKRISHPRQIEFARMNLTHTVMSKRKLRALVEDKHVRGWDDPRMPTLCAFRRRGYTAEAIRDLCKRSGVAKFDGANEIALAEHCVREHLNKAAPRVMAVLRPLKVVITNWGEHGDPNRTDELEAVNNPEDPSAGTRVVPFSGELYIERDDFLEDPPKKFFRLAPGREVRLRYAYFITCQEVVKNDAGEVVELRCTYDPATRGGDAPDGRKVKATLHWVSARHALNVEARLYDHLFSVPYPEDVKAAGAEAEAQALGTKVPVDANAKAASRTTTDWKANLNPNSLEVVTDCKLELNWNAAKVTWPDGILRMQFERLGYFCLDSDSDPDAIGGPRLVFNRTVTLRDTWAKVQKRGE